MIYFNKNATDNDINIRVVLPIKAMLANCKDGVDVEIREHKRKRTNEQNRFYWLNVNEIATVLNEAGASYGDYGLAFSTEIIHEINKKMIGEATTTKMSVKEFGEYMEKVFSFWIEKTNGFFQPKESVYSYLERTGLV